MNSAKYKYKQIKSVSCIKRICYSWIKQHWPQYSL